MVSDSMLNQGNMILCHGYMEPAEKLEQRSNMNIVASHFGLKPHYLKSYNETEHWFWKRLRKWGTFWDTRRIDRSNQDFKNVGALISVTKPLDILGGYSDGCELVDWYLRNYLIHKMPLPDVAILYSGRTRTDKLFQLPYLVKVLVIVIRNENEVYCSEEELMKTFASYEESGATVKVLEGRGNHFAWWDAALAPRISELIHQHLSV